MKIFAILTLILSYFVAFILGQAPVNAGVAINIPTLNQTVYAGSNLTITWTILDANATTINAISLMDGDALNLNWVIHNILTNGPIQVSDRKYVWTVPTNLTTRNDYVIAMRGNNSYYTYSDYFTIINENNSS
ncbi:uncharacterized protein BX663DRAFT_501133 [Cokeromyces recurvatus]|uniref:uncharacterized protein n=1 Tax=Cokeromyces recurvatus TaxID=90255 RepID=UPI00221FC539|nr:uncharacterized protein BX663DRAFT_501133 [Cokeromyces recurvatus]KAI7904952.1 hypothetical protein BX663DRAFT_501133 [Cokeromyces recurvatus]